MNILELIMSRERDLLQTALGILEDYEWGYGGDHHKSPEASILNDIRKLLAQPEQITFKDDADKIAHLENSVELLAGLLDAKKREPIEDGELEVWYSQHTWAMDKQEYMWGFRDAEKAHGIGSGE